MYATNYTFLPVLQCLGVGDAFDFYNLVFRSRLKTHFLGAVSLNIPHSEYPGTSIILLTIADSTQTGDMGTSLAIC